VGKIYDFDKIDSLDEKRQVLKELIGKPVRITMQRITSVGMTAYIELDPEDITGIIKNVGKRVFGIKENPEEKYPQGEIISHIIKLELL